ncbi:MAG: hypothetical protein EOP64_11205 [Sphingomonas sp.]|nr:MAG: hypothetical protein EOP64_11205 [Sphingomonas sp.]
MQGLLMMNDLPLVVSEPTHSCCAADGITVLLEAPGGAAGFDDVFKPIEEGRDHIGGAKDSWPRTKAPPYAVSVRMCSNSPVRGTMALAGQAAQVTTARSSKYLSLE